MKKLVSLLLAAAMLLSLAACGGAKNVNGTVEQTSAVASEAAAPAPTEAPAPESAAEPAASVQEEASVQEVASAEETEPAETPVASAAEEEPVEEQVELGVTEGGRYVNTFLGIACELDESWVFASEDELAQMIGVMTTDVIDDAELAEKIKQSDLIYDMLAVNPGDQTTINVVMQNLGVLAGMVLSAEDYVDLALETLDTDMASAGILNVVAEKRTVFSAGEDRLCLHIAGESQGMPYYCQQIYIKQGSYIAVISVSSFNEDTTDQMLTYFTAA